MGRKRTQNVPPPLPAAVRVAVHAPRETAPDEMCKLGDRCVAGGVANPKTVGQSPFLPPVITGLAAVREDIPAADGGSVVARSNLLAGTRKLHGAIMAHAGWVDTQMLDMTPADAAAYAVAAGFTTAKVSARTGILAMEVKNGPKGSLLLLCDFPNPPGRCMSFTEYSVDDEKSWTRGPDTELSHVALPAIFATGQAVAVRLRQYLRGTGYTPWVVFKMNVI